MNLKAIIQKIASWFKSEANAVEVKVVNVASSAEADVASELARLAALIPEGPIKGLVMSTPAADTQAAAATAGNNVNTAVQLALALKAIDPSLSVEAVQAATNAALTAAYPVAAAA
jgi:hypothetical protein